MKKFLRSMIALVALTLGVGLANAASEERILRTSTSDAGWPAFAQEIFKIEIDGVRGYDPKTDEVQVWALVKRVCGAQSPSFVQACKREGDALEALQARMGWGDTITGAALRVQGQSAEGIKFFFGTTEEAKVARAASLAALAQAKVAANGTTPAVTPEQPKAFEANNVAAQTALQRQVAENSEAVKALRNQIAAKDAAVVQLRDAVSKAPTAAAVNSINVQIAAINKDREVLKKQMSDDLTSIVKAAGSAAAQAVAPAASQAADALTAAADLGDRFDSLEARVDGVSVGQKKVSAVDRKSTLAIVLSLIGILSAIAIGAFFWLKGDQKFREAKQVIGQLTGKCEDAAKKAVQAQGMVRNVEIKVDEVIDQTGVVLRGIAGFQRTVEVLGGRVDQQDQKLAATAGWVVLPSNLMIEVTKLTVGGKYRPLVQVTGADGQPGMYWIEISPHPEKGEGWLEVNGIDRLHEVKIDNLEKTLNRAGGFGGGVNRYGNLELPDAPEERPVGFITIDTAPSGDVAVTLSASANDADTMMDPPAATPPSGDVAAAATPVDTTDQPVATIPSGDEVVAEQPVVPGEKVFEPTLVRAQSLADQLAAQTGARLVKPTAEALGRLAVRHRNTAK